MLTVEAVFERDNVGSVTDPGWYAQISRTSEYDGTPQLQAGAHSRAGDATMNWPYRAIVVPYVVLCGVFRFKFFLLAV